MIRGMTAVASMFALVLPALMLAGCHGDHYRHAPRYGFGYYDYYYDYNYGHYNYSRPKSHAPSRPPEPRHRPERPEPEQIRPEHSGRPEPGRMRPERPGRAGDVRVRPGSSGRPVTSRAKPGKPPASESENRPRVRPAQAGKSGQAEELRLTKPVQTRPAGQTGPRRN